MKKYVLAMNTVPAKNTLTPETVQNVKGASHIMHDIPMESK